MEHGRPPIPIERHIARLCEAVRRGASYDMAAKYAGISPRTFHTWRSKAETAEPGSSFAKLRDALDLAEAEAVVNWLTHIDNAATEGFWQAAAWKLERRYPEQYSRKDHSAQGQLISDLLRVVLQEVQPRQRMPMSAVEAEWTPMHSPQLPAPPDPSRPTDDPPPDASW
jgi:hypothetical protein